MSAAEHFRGRRTGDALLLVRGFHAVWPRPTGPGRAASSLSPGLVWDCGWVRFSRLEPGECRSLGKTHDDAGGLSNWTRFVHIRSRAHTMLAP